MLCATCGQVNGSGNSRCVHCGTTLFADTPASKPEQGGEASKGRNRTLYGWVGLFAAIVVFQCAVPYLFGPRKPGGIDLVQTIVAMLFGVGGMLAGRKLADWISK